MLTSAIAGALAVALCLVGAMWLSDRSSEALSQEPVAQQHVPSAPPVDLFTLTESSTYTTIEDAPPDPGRFQPTTGAIVHPTKLTAVYAAPDGRPIAKIGPKQLGDTWLPVIAQRDGWVRVLLPSRPNGSSGWLSTSDVERALTPYIIKAHLKSMVMELIVDGLEVESWPIGTGKAETPTPVGRTFILGSITDPNQKYSPVILPLGAHSETLDSFGGGPGTVAIHTWPTDNVFGTASSEGCIRVPQDALNRLTEVPLGTLVLVDQD